MQISAPVISIGWLIAIVVLVLAIVFLVLGQIDLRVGGLIVGLALARIIP